MKRLYLVWLMLLIGVLAFSCVTPEPKNYVLTVNLNDTEMGSVALSPSQPVEGYEEGTVVTLSPNPTTGHEFVEWTGADGDDVTEENTIVMDSDKTVMANFEVKTFNLTVEAQDVDGVGDPEADGVVINLDPDLTVYPYGTEVILTPQNLDLGTGQGWIFNEWGDETQDIPKTIQITEDTTIIAKYSLENIFKITTGSVTNGSIRIDSFGGEDADGTIHIAYDDVEIYATPMPGYEFTGWTDDATGTANPLTVTMDTDKTIGATFASVGTTSLIEDFENGIDYGIWTRGWSVTGDDGEADAVIEKDFILNGENSMKVYATNQGQRRMWNVLNVDVSDVTEISFWVKVDCSPYADGNGNKDKFMFFIDDAADDEFVVLSGHLDWQQYTFTLQPGEHELMWGFFAFNAQSSEGTDAAYVDDIVIGDNVTVLNTGPELTVGYSDIELPDDGGASPVDIGIVGSDIPFSLYVENSGIQSQVEENTITISSITLETTSDLTITPPTLPLTLDIWDIETFTMTASGTTEITSGLITVTSDYPAPDSEYTFKISVTPTSPVFHDDFDGTMEPDTWSNMYYSAGDYQGELPVIETGTGINGSDSLYYDGVEYTQIAVIDIDVGASGAKIMSQYQFYDNYGYFALYDNSSSYQSYAAAIEFDPILEWTPFVYELDPGVHEIMIKLYSGFGSYARLDEFVVLGDASIIPTEPKMIVEYDTYKYFEIPDDSVDYSIDNVLDSAVLEFRISNIGKKALDLDGTPIIDVTGDGTLSTTITPDSTVPIAETTTFAVDVTAGLGPKDITISIPNSDPNKDPYNFNVVFEAEDPTPRAVIIFEERIDGEWVETEISSGGNITMEDIVNLENREYEFIIRNIGTGTLTLTNPRVSLTNMTDFNILSMPEDQYIPPFGGEETYELIFYSDGKSSGLYSTDVTVNEGSSYTYTLNVSIVDPVSIFTDDFEDGIDPTWNGNFTGVIAPVIDTNYQHNGTSSIRLGSIEPTPGDENVAPYHDEYSGIFYEFSEETTKDHIIKFWYKVDAQNTSGTYQDYLGIYKNGTDYARWKVPNTYVNDTWAYAEYLIPHGTETIEFRYDKDDYTSEGKDCAWVDDVEIVGVP
jgi:uncharacterized repeat protein (TIGR02543 family)